jgi:hypothetical protein
MEEGLESYLGIFQVAYGILASTAQIAYRFILGLWYVDGIKVSGAQEACELYGIAAIGLDPVSSFLRNKRGSDHHAVEAFFGQVPIEAVATGPGFIGQEEPSCFGPEAA